MLATINGCLLVRRHHVHRTIWNAFVTDLQKANIIIFENPDYCISEIHILKALFCSNINTVLQIVFEL